MTSRSIKPSTGNLKRPVDSTPEGVMNTNQDRTKATYFGIDVEILASLENCSLVRLEQREFIVETADLTLAKVLAKAA